jgi:hypothetical protein
MVRCRTRPTPDEDENENEDDDATARTTDRTVAVRTRRDVTSRPSERTNDRTNHHPIRMKKYATR